MFGRRPSSSAAVATPPPAQRNGVSVDQQKLPPTVPDEDFEIDVLNEPEALWQPSEAVPTRKKSVDALLLERGQISEDQLDQAKAVAAQTPGKSLAQILLTMHAASEAHILSALAETLNLGFEQPDKSQVEQQAFELLPVEYIRKQGVIPLRFDGSAVVV